MRHYDSFIGGADLPASSVTLVPRASAMIDRPREVFDAKRRLELAGARHGDAEVSEDFVASIALADAEQISLATEAAARAFPDWADIPVDERARVFELFRKTLAAREAELLDLLVAEGHPRQVARWELTGVHQGTSEAQESVFLEQMQGRQYRPGSRDLTLCRKPDGVVCMSPPQNATAANSALGVFALLAGNALVVQPPRSAPASTFFLYREIVVPILQEVGAPPGTVNIFCSSTERTLRSWLRDPQVDDIFYFGDSDLGLKLGQDCVQAGKKPVLELAGNDCCVVWHDADLDQATDALLDSFLASGQICLVPKLAIVHPRIAPDLVPELARRAEALSFGYPEDDSTILSPVVKVERFFSFLAEAKDAGATVVAGGRRRDVRGVVTEIADDGVFLEPTVVVVDGLSEARGIRCVAEETFFPLLPVVVPEEGADDDVLGNVISFVNGNAYGLRNSLWARDPSVIDRFVRQVRTGGLLKVNESHIEFPPYLAGHGGTGRSGGVFGELNYPALRTTHLQGVSVSGEGS